MALHASGSLANGLPVVDLVQSSVASALKAFELRREGELRENSEEGRMAMDGHGVRGLRPCSDAGRPILQQHVHKLHFLTGSGFNTTIPTQ
jgi:hypothetical protein